MKWGSLKLRIVYAVMLIASLALAAGANVFVCMCDAPDELLSAIDRCLKRDEPCVESNR